MSVDDGMPTRYLTLDAMRGIAALLVVAFHLQQLWDGNAFSGYLAVDLFLALSGFVIALNYTHRFAHGLTVGRFLQLRLIRLYPLYMFGFALGIAMLFSGSMLQIGGDASTGDVACAVLLGAAMLPDPCSAILFPVNGPAWSLFFELAINLVFALVLWRSSLKLLALLMGVSLFYFLYRFGPPHYFNMGWAWQNFFGGMMRTVFSFCVGVVLFRVLPRAWRRQSYASLLPILVVAIVLGVMVPEANRIAFEILAVVLILPAMLFLGCLFDAPTPLLRRIFGLLGDLSYPLYVIHWPLQAIAVPVMEWLRLPPWLSLTLFLCAILPIAYVAAWVDGIVRSKISAALKRRQSANLQVV